MKLAFICTEKLPCPPIKGGAIQIMIDGVSSILRKKHDLTVFSITDPKLPNRERKRGIRYIRLPAKNYETNVATELARHTFDVVHVFNRPKYVSKYKDAAPKSRFVLSLHNEMFAKKKITLKNGMKTINTVENIMTVSDYIGRTITKRFPKAKSKIKTVYSGCDLHDYIPIWSSKAEAIRAKLRRKYGLKNKKVILFVGRLSENKAPHNLVKAMEHILPKHKDAVLVITGGKWFSDDGMNGYVRYLYKLAKPLGKKVIFTKYIPSNKIAKHYLIGDVFACSSQWQEPLARVHYEAMGAGLPIVTTKRGGNGEIITHKENGMLVKKYKKPKAFAKAINFLLSNPKRAANMGKKGRIYVEEKFDFNHVAKRLEKVYQDALK